MPFIGNQPALSYTSFAKQDFTTSATTSYTLDQPVANENEIALFINFVRQEPTTAYTASGTTLTLTSATSASDDMYCVFLGKAVQTVNPPNGSVGLSQLSATGTKDSTTFLRGDNTFDTPPLGGITMADQWRLTATTNLGTSGDVTSNWERVDSPGWSGIGTGLTESSGIFTFPQTGIYKIDFIGVINQDDGDGNVEFSLYNTIDNSTYYEAVQLRGGNTGSSDANGTVAGVFLFDVTNTTTHKFKFRTNSFSGTTLLTGDTSVCSTGFNVIRLGDT